MNNEQAKFILGAYRPDGRDAGDPTFAEALAQARSDPALGAWLAREQAFDGAVAAKLRTVAPPAGLREAILTGARVSTTPVRRRWRTPAWLAMAASFAVILGLAGTFWFRSVHPAPAALDRLAKFALVEPFSAHTGPHADKLGTFGAWLRNPVNRLAAVPAVNLNLLRSQGCRSIDIAGHQVFEICFQHGTGTYHLYIGRQADFTPGPGETAPVFFERGKRIVAAWANHQLVYVLMAVGNTGTLRKIL